MHLYVRYLHGCGWEYVDSVSADNSKEFLDREYRLAFGASFEYEWR